MGLGKMREIDLSFGRKGYELIKRQVGGLVSGNVESLCEAVLRYVEERIPADVDTYESALDFQVSRLIVPKLLEYLREGKVPKTVRIVIWEATPVLQSLAKKAGKSLKAAERYWEETKKDYLKRTGKQESELKDKDWRYITGVVKKRLGLPVKRVARKRGGEK